MDCTGGPGVGMGTGELLDGGSRLLKFENKAGSCDMIVASSSSLSSLATSLPAGNEGKVVVVALLGPNPASASKRRHLCASGDPKPTGDEDEVGPELAITSKCFFLCTSSELEKKGGANVCELLLILVSNVAPRTKGRVATHDMGRHCSSSFWEPTIERKQKVRGEGRKQERVETEGGEETSAKCVEMSPLWKTQAVCVDSRPPTERIGCVCANGSRPIDVQEWWRCVLKRKNTTSVGGLKLMETIVSCCSWDVGGA